MPVLVDADLVMPSPPVRRTSDASHAAFARGDAAEGAVSGDADGQGWVGNRGVSLAPPDESRRGLHRAHSTADVVVETPERPTPGHAIGALLLSPSKSAGGVAAASVWAAALASNAAEDVAAVSRPGGHEDAGDHLPTIVVSEQAPQAAAAATGEAPPPPGPVSRPETHGDGGDLPALILARGGGSGGVSARPGTRSSRDVMPAATAWDATPVVVPVLSGSLRRVPSIAAMQAREISARSARVGSWVENGSARQRPRFAGGEGAASAAGHWAPAPAPLISGWTQVQVQRQQEEGGQAVPLVLGAAEPQRPRASTELLPPACVVAGDMSDGALPRLPPELLESFQGGAGQQRGLVRSESGADLPRTRTQASAGAVVGQAVSRRRPVSAARWGVVRAPGARQPGVEETAAAFAVEDLLLESDSDG